jgi:hypothetical protein
MQMTTSPVLVPMQTPNTAFGKEPKLEHSLFLLLLPLISTLNANTPGSAKYNALPVKADHCHFVHTFRPYHTYPEGGRMQKKRQG